MLNLAKKTAIVSGGSKGIGAIAMKLAQAVQMLLFVEKKKILILQLMKQNQMDNFDSY